MTRRLVLVVVLAFVAGVLTGAPPWATRYLLIGAVLCALVALVVPRKDT